MYVVRNGQTAISLTYCLSLYVVLSHQSGLSALVISARMEDKSDIHLRRNSLCEKINNVLYYFSHCDPFVKSKLVHYYCCDLYRGGGEGGGCSGTYLNQMLKIYVQHGAKGCEGFWGLPYRTYSALLYRISNMLPLKYYY